MGAGGRLRRAPAGVEQRQADRPAPVAVLEPARRRVRRLARAAGRACSRLIRAADRRAGRRRLHRHREGAGGGEGAAVHPPHHLGRGHRAVPAGGGLRLRLGHAGRGVGVPRHDAVAWRHPDVDLEEQGDADALPQGRAPRRIERAVLDGRLRVRRRHRAVPARCGTAAASSPPRRRCRSRCSPSAASATRTRSTRSSTAARPTWSASAGPFYAEPDLARAHPRRATRARACASTRTSASRPRCSGMKGACYNPAVVTARPRVGAPRRYDTRRPMSAVAWQTVLDRLDDAAKLADLDPDIHRLLRTPRARARGGRPGAHGRRHASRCSPAGGCTTTRPAAPARAASASTPTSTPTR